MEWQQIMGFYHVAKLKSFTRAAEATFRTQSALAQQIKALEEEFDCQLFERIGKRKVILTSVGERFFTDSLNLFFLTTTSFVKIYPSIRDSRKGDCALRLHSQHFIICFPR
jgi:Bacterial regulatory helix-turn-helix protein, lysR family